MTAMTQIEENLRREAKRLLESGEVSVVLAYGRGYDENHPMPYAARKAEEADNLIFNEYCTYNLARYLPKYPPKTRIAVAVKAADSRAVVQLIQEEKLRREDLVILGIPVVGMKDPKTGEAIDQKTTCNMANPVIYDILLGDEIHGIGGGSPYDCLAELEAMDQGRPLGLLEKGIQQMHPLLRLPQGLSHVLLRPLLHGCIAAPLDRQIAHGRRSSDVPSDAVLSSGGEVHRLRRMFPRLSRGHPALPLPQETGQGM